MALGNGCQNNQSGNVCSNKYQTNYDIGVPSSREFVKEVEKYCYMWREGGQFSTKKYDSMNS